MPRFLLPLLAVAALAGAGLLVAVGLAPPALLAGIGLVLLLTLPSCRMTIAGAVLLAAIYLGGPRFSDLLGRLFGEAVLRHEAPGSCVAQIREKMAVLERTALAPSNFRTLRRAFETRLAAAPA